MSLEPTISEAVPPSPTSVARLRRWFALRNGRGPQDMPCPEPDELWAAVHKELPPDQVHRIVDHLAVCPVCAEDWRLAAHVGGQATVEALRAMPTREVALHRRPHHFQKGLAAAVLLAAAASIPVTTWWVHRSETTVRSATTYTIRAEQPAGEALAREEPVLRWTAGPPGTVYNVEVMAGIDTVASEHRLATAELTLDAATVAALATGSVLQWNVIATLPSGSEVESATFEAKLE
jgi:hypothetical protein